MTAIAARLADATGLGEAVVGSLFLGGCNSLAGIVTSAIAAAGGHAELAVSNALGGIATQTAFLGLASIAYRNAPQKRAPADLANLLQATLLIILLTIPLIGMASPRVTILGIHPVSLLLPVAYLGGLGLIAKAQKATPIDEAETVESDNRGLFWLWLQFFGLAAAVAAAGYAVARAGVAIATQSGFSESLVGSLFTAVSSALPELVTVLAAARQGAIALAVGSIVGGDTFDVLLVAFSDFAYRQGSIYAGLKASEVFLLALTILMAGLILLGLLRREKFGSVNFSVESVMVLIVYFVGFSILFFGAGASIP